MKKLTRICLLLSLLAFTFSPPSFASVVTFDGFPNGSIVPNGYNGFNWTNVSSDWYAYYNSIYNNSLIPISGENFAFNSLGNVASITKANNFIFNGAYLTGWGQGDAPFGSTASSVTIDGYLGGNHVSTYVANLTVDSNMVYHTTGWSNPVDKVVFTPNPGGKNFLMDNFTYTDLPVSLKVNVTGTGSGSVTSTPIGIVCGATCSSDFTVNTLMSLTASPFDYSIFTGWTGTICSGTVPCSFTLTAPTTIGANFDIDNAHSVSTDPPLVYYPSLQNAFDWAPAGVVKAWGMTFIEPLSFNRAVTINLQGGQNVGYTAQTGMTTIKGSMTIVKGCLVADRVTIM
jgi:hypothetical protein